MTLHFSNGKVLLQNTSDNLWYYLGIVIAEELPTLNPEQIGIVVESDKYSSYIVLKDTDNNYYKISLITNSGIITYEIDLLTTPEPFNKIFLLGNNDLIYQVIVTVIDNIDYLQILDYNNIVLTSIPLPWRAITSIDFVVNTTVVVGE